MDLHIHYPALDRMQTDNTSHASTHSCADLASAICEHKSREENPFYQQPEMV